MVGAQEPVALNETKIGQISAEAPQPFYNFTAQAGQSVRIEIIGTAEGLAPQFAILTSAGALVQAIGNPGLTLTVDSTVTFAQAGLYLIQVSSATNATGQFVLQLSEGAPPAPAIPLSQAQTTVGQVSPGERVTYSLSGSPQFALDLIVMATTTGVEVTLRDGAGTVIGMLGRGLTGGQFGLPVGQAAYRLELAHDGSNPGIVPYQLLLTSSGGAPVQPTVPAPAAATETAPPTATLVAGALPTLPVTGACVAATATNVNVNIRAGTSTDADVIGRMDPQGVYTVLAANSGRSWYQIAFNGSTGWVAASVMRTGGDCTTLTVVNPPPQATGAPPPAPTEPGPTLTLAGPPFPGPEPTLSVRELHTECVATFFDTGARYYAAEAVCYSCPAAFELIGFESSASPMQCVGPETMLPSLIVSVSNCSTTDQVGVEEGTCWVCPSGYHLQYPWIVSACVRDNPDGPDPIRLGSLTDRKQ